MKENLRAANSMHVFQFCSMVLSVNQHSYKKRTFGRQVKWRVPSGVENVGISSTVQQQLHVGLTPAQNCLVQSRLKHVVLPKQKEQCALAKNRTSTCLCKAVKERNGLGTTILHLV